MSSQSNRQLKRIVIDARESGTTTGRYVDKLVEHIYQLRPNYQFVILAKPHRLDFFKQVAPDFEIIESNVKEFTFAEQTKLLQQFKSLKPDLLFVPMTQQPILYRGPVVTAILDLTTARFRNLSKNRLIFTFKQLVYRCVIWIVAHKSVQIITPSQFVRQDVAAYAHVNLSKITAIYDSADKLTIATQAYDPAKGKQFIMYVGRPLSHKNLNRLVDAFNLLDRPDLQLIFVGKTDVLYQKLRTYAQTTPAAKRIIFAGFVPDAQLRWLYEHATAYVFPSLSEGFGLPPLEAMHYNTPVVSSNATCLPEVLQDAALYFDPLSSADMADKIDQLLSDPHLAAQLVASGRHIVASYSWQRTAQQTLDVFAKALRD
ncbi:MAG: glycosyltransferase family 1 protein [Candidatus Saccharimonadales bacterium]